MADDTENTEDQPDAAPADGVGPQLRAAREKKGLTVEQVAAETRISQHHIRAIEEGDFSQLPGRTYAIGFAKNFAKVVELDQQDVADMVRAELNAHGPPEQPARQTFEPGDPARAPSRTLVWLSVFGVAMLLAGLFAAVRTMFQPAAELPSLVEQQEAEEQRLAREQTAAEAQPDAAQSPSGPVVFTATEEPVWVRFYDAEGRRLMETEMAEGETYTVPDDVEGPQLWTGRPDALEITIGGREIPRLATEMTTLQDVPVDAASLLARSERQAATPSSPAP